MSFYPLLCFGGAYTSTDLTQIGGILTAFRGICMTCMGLVHNYAGLMTAVSLPPYNSFFVRMLIQHRRDGGSEWLRQDYSLVVCVHHLQV